MEVDIWMDNWDFMWITGQVKWICVVVGFFVVVFILDVDGLIDYNGYNCDAFFLL